MILCGARVAPAATVQVGGLSVYTNALGRPPYASSALFQAPKFPTSLGTLQSVTLEFRLNYTGEIAMSNSTLEQQAVVSASSSIPVLVDYPGGEAEFTVNASFDTISPILAFKLGPSSPGGPVGFTFAGASGMSALPAVGIPANDLPAYLGPGKVSFNLFYGNGSANGSNPSVEYFASATSFATVNVTYDFIPIPEPSSLALATIAACIAAVIRRRKRVVHGPAVA